MKSQLAAALALSVLFALSASAGEVVKKTSLYAGASTTSEALEELSKGTEVTVTGPELRSGGEDWLSVTTGGKAGFVRSWDVRLSADDRKLLASHRDPDDRGFPEYNPEWFIQTSPVGDVVKRYNLQAGRFFGAHGALSLKGTYMDKATQSIFGDDEGFEVGVRGAYFFRPGSGKVRVGIHPGIYYVNYKRGDFLDDVFYSNYDRDVIKGPMFELMSGATIHWNAFLISEFLGGLQGYTVDYRTYDRTNGNETTRRASEFRIYAVAEATFGFTF